MDIIEKIKSIFNGNSENKIKEFFELPVEYRYASVEVYRSWHTVYFEVQPDENYDEYTQITFERDKLFNVHSGKSNYTLPYKNLKLKHSTICLDNNDYNFVDIHMSCYNTQDEKVDIGICIDLTGIDAVRVC